MLPLYTRAFRLASEPEHFAHLADAPPERQLRDKKAIDVVVLTKLKSTGTGDTLAPKGTPVVIARPEPLVPLLALVLPFAVYLAPLWYVIFDLRWYCC